MTGDYMKRTLFMLGTLLLLIMPQAFAATTSPYPNPYRQTTWNNLTDSMHTLGQSPTQAQQTIRKLHYARNKTRLKNISQAQRAAYKAKRQAWLNSQITQ